MGHVRRGSEAYITIKEYCERTGISTMQSVSMLAGECAGSNNRADEFKDGTIKLADPTHAGIVADIIMHMKKCGISFASTSLIVQSISKVVMVKDFDVSIFKHKISTFPALIEKKQNLQQYLALIEDVYNHKQSKQRIPLAFLAEDAARERKSNFGRVRPNKKSAKPGRNKKK
jgi:hypothetical protein